MQLREVPDQWTGQMARTHVSDAGLSKSAAEVVRVARETHDRNNAAAVEFAALDRIDRLVHAVKRWQGFHRGVCRRDRNDCTCKSILDTWGESGLVAELIEASMPWARLTRAEIARQVASLTRAARRALASLNRLPDRTSTVSASGDRGPARLLITPLTRAPGAPPQGFETQLQEGLRAA